MAARLSALARRLRIRPEDRLPPGPAIGETVARPLPWLVAITAVGAALRVPGLGGDLWYDEIATLQTALQPLGAVLLAPDSLNDHALHTVSLRLAVEAFGVREWAIRLPAVTFGVATIPAVYLLARRALGSREALFASAIVATSYHHVLFSQNARGYTMLLFWVALSTLLLHRAMARDRGRDWALYAATAFLAVLAMLLGGLALLGQLAALALVARRIQRSGGSPGPVVAKAATVIAAVGLVGLAFYGLRALELTSGVAPAGAPWTEAEGPHGFWYELGRGLRSGLGLAGLVAAVLAALPLAVGGLRFAFRYPVYAGLLVAPIVPVVVLGAVGFHVTPRYFLWTIPAFAIGLPAAAGCLGGASRWAGLVATGLIVAASTGSLPGLYATPKQPTRTSLEWAARRSAPRELLVPVSLAALGARFYAPRIDPPASRRIVEASTLEDLLAIERRRTGRRIWLLTTHRRALLNEHPRLLERIERCYRPEEEFPATIHRMEITVWRGPVGDCSPSAGDESSAGPSFARGDPRHPAAPRSEPDGATGTRP